MKNPLWKRLPRELKSDFGKYIVIFLFLTLTIGFVSGFLVADDSMLAAYDEGFEKYNIEHGNFTFSSKASENDLKRIEEQISSLEERDGQIDVEMSNPEIFTNSVKCQELSQEKAEIITKLESLYEEWESLAE